MSVNLETNDLQALRLICEGYRNAVNMAIDDPVNVGKKIKDELEDKLCTIYGSDKLGVLALLAKLAKEIGIEEGETLNESNLSVLGDSDIVMILFYNLGCSRICAYI